MNTLKKVIVTIVFSTLGLSFASNAGPIVTSWDFEIDTTFTTWLPGGVVGSDANTNLGGATLLEWGSGDDGPSYLEIDSGTNGNLEGMDLDNGDIALVTSLTHQNNPIFPPSLDSATLRTRLTLDGGAGDFTLADLDFGITFEETTNSSPCGFNTATATPCDDIFIITPPAGVGGFFDSDLMAFIFYQNFEYDGNAYIAQLIVEGLMPLVPSIAPPLMSACAYLSLPEGCIGFITEEGETNTFETSLRILVPEPSSILLMSLAIFGIASSMRNKHI